MIGDSFTTDNLLDILKAMQKIKPIDQSKCYEDYLEEIMNRLRYAKDRQDWIENQLQKAIKNQNLQNDKNSKY
jgi:aspartokinase